MNEKKTSAATPKNKVSYTILNPVIPRSTVKRNTPPPIGPEIGPDPRSSIGARVSMSELPLIKDKSGILFDFEFGYRIKFPEGNQQYRLRVYDLDSGMPLEERMCKGGEIIVGENKYYVRYRLEAYVNDKLVFEHDYNCEDQEVCIIIPDGGLGDNLAWLPYLEKFRLIRKAKVTAVIGEWMIRLCQAQYPGLKFIPLGTKPSLKFAYAIYFCGIFEEDRKPWRPVEHQHLGMQKAVAQILGLPLENLHCRIPLGSPRPVKEPYVCISTMATNPTKYWNFRSSASNKDPDGWNILIRWLRSYGYRVFVLDRDKELTFTDKHHYQVPSEAEDLTGRIPVIERIHYLEHADFFVGLPSGLSWLAWNCNIPVVMISGFTMDGSEFPTPYRVTNFLFCHGCWNDTHLFFDSKAPVWCPRHVGTPREIECTKTITPKMVQETIMRIPAFQKHLAEMREQELLDSFREQTVPGTASTLISLPPRMQKKKAYVIGDGKRDATILLPVYRANPDYLRLTLDSVIRLASMQGNTEVILFNDCSPDDSWRIIDEYADRYPGIVRKMKSAHNLGVGNARTEMCKAARGRYILSFDQDDIMLPFDLGGVIDMMDRNPQYGASYSQKFLFDEKGLTGEVHGGSPSMFNAFFTPKMNINAMVIRADTLAAHEYFRPVPDCAINDDVFLMIRLGADTEFHFDEGNPRVLYRMHEKQNSLRFHHENQTPFRWMAEYMTEQRPELYRRILENKPPELTPENIRWVLGLMGAAIFLRQMDLETVIPIAEKACELVPDDYGAWEHRLLLLCMANRYDEFMKVFETAVGKFRGQSPTKELQIIRTMDLYFRKLKKTLPKSVSARSREILKQIGTPPQIVLDNLPK